MEFLTNQMTLLGRVVDHDALARQFRLRVRSGDEIMVTVEDTTWAEVITNLDLYNRDRVPTPTDHGAGGPANLIRKYVRMGRLLQVEGLLQKQGETWDFFARRITILSDRNGRGYSEQQHWWLTQIRETGDAWLRYISMENGQYDFARYRTNIDISGVPTDVLTQECATLSRLIYGLSSAYALTGSERFIEAARAGVAYQRERFVSPTEDGQGLIWAHALVRNQRIIDSQNIDDLGTIPLYEQIYALAGLSQYYRITLDPHVLYDIKRTIYAFNLFFHDPPERGKLSSTRPDEVSRGYFSHIDFESMSPHEPLLGYNRSRKNWNSVGDHLPAYLINLLVALDPLPTGLNDPETTSFVATLHVMFDELAELILTKMPDPDDPSYFVRERFHGNWQYDPDWRWQKDRAVVGHNFKIVWNLTRAAIAYQNRGDTARASRFFTFATRLCQRMAHLGIDPVRGGVYDVVEREPPERRSRKLPRLSWWSTKDFWQQEQGILAGLIVYGFGKTLERDNKDAWRAVLSNETPDSFLELGRELMAYWNLYFLDRDDRGIFFRTNEDGLPYLLGSYRNKGGHAIAGYHSFELSYLAHIYLSAFVRSPEAGMTLKFKPSLHARQRTLNVLPDFLPKSLLRIEHVLVDGHRKAEKQIDGDQFVVMLDEDDLGRNVIVQFAVVRDW